MIENGKEIVILKVANGFAVYENMEPGSYSSRKEMLVFNHIGYASGDDKCPTDETLLGFIAKHFGKV